MLTRVRPAPKSIVEALKERDGDQAIDVGQVTYASDVAAIVQEKCQSCHRPGAAGPFALMSYEDARKHKAVIREVVDERRMPPGMPTHDSAISRTTAACLATKGRRSLAWIDQGTPLGDPAKMPEPKTFPDRWTVGTPDVVFSIPADYVVAATGELPYQRFTVPTGFTEDRWVQSIEARPGDKQGGPSYHRLPA